MDEFHMSREGSLYHQIAGQNIYGDTATTPNSVIGTVSIDVPPGRILRLHSLSFSATRAINASGQIIKGSYGGPSTGSTRMDVRFNTGTTGGTINHNMQGTLLYEDGLLSLTVVANDTLRASWNFMPFADLLTYDLNYDAKYTYLALGDSITEGHTMGSDALGARYLGEWNFTNKLRDLLRNNDGIDIRVWNDGFGGGKTGNMLKAIKAGRYQHINPDLVTISFGTNEASSAATASQLATFKSNIAYAISYFYRKNPGCAIIILGAPSTDQTARVPNVQAFRDAAKLVATTEKPIMDANVFYYGMNRAFAMGVNDALYFNNTETPNNYIHPSGAGSTLFALNTAGDPDNGISAGNDSGIYAVVRLSQFYLGADRDLPVV